MSKRFDDHALFGLLCLFLLIWQLSLPVFAQTQPQVVPASTPKRVLLLYTYGDGLPAYQKATPAFLSVMTAAGVNINDLFFEYLDLQRNDNAEYRQRLAGLLRYKYAKHQVGLIVTVHTQALNFLLDEAKGLFPDAVVFSYLIIKPELIEAKNTGRRILQRPQNLDMKGTLEIALKMFPQTRKIVFVTGTAEGDQRFEREAKRTFEPWRDKLEFQYTSDRSVEEILQWVATLPPGSVVIYGNVFSDKTGRTFIPRKVGEMVAKAANAPVFCLWDTLMGGGVIGGSLLSFEAEGTYAANVVLDMLNGKILLTRPVTTLPSGKTYMFDWQQLKRWGVNESILPKGSVLVNRVPTLWEQHKALVVAGIVAFLAQTALVIGLLIQRNLKKKAELSVRQKTEELDQFFNVTLDLLCIANTDGYFLRVNPAMERALGYSPEELIARPFFDFVHPDDLGKTREAVSTQITQQKVSGFENRYRCKDGTYRWLEWSSVPAGNLLYAAARDVTERRLAEEALESRLRFERLVSKISASLVNIPPDRVDSEIERGLRRMLEFFQVDRAGLIRSFPDRSGHQITHGVYSENVPSVPVGVELPRSIYPWVYEKLAEKHEVVSFSRLDDLPPEANVDKQTYAKWGVRSALDIPIITGGSAVHVIAINSVKSERVWPEEIIPRLRLLGEIFVNALERKQAEEASRESERLLRQNESDLRRLAGRLISAQEEERSRLARELHDDLAQRLAVFAIDVGRLEQQWVDPPAPVQEELRQMRENIFKISQDVHNLSRQLHPSILDDLGLIKAVESECTNFSKREGIEVVFNHENISTIIPKDVSLSLYRIIQEGLSNISKHACAEHISVSLKGIDHDVLLSVQDDGIGFDLAEVKEKPGLGFSSMRERARLIHGGFSIRSQPNKGTLITVRAPLMREGE